MILLKLINYKKEKKAWIVGFELISLKLINYGKGKKEKEKEVMSRTGISRRKIGFIQRK
jgi:hypothetical protein